MSAVLNRVDRVARHANAFCQLRLAPPILCAEHANSIVHYWQPSGGLAACHLSGPYGVSDDPADKNQDHCRHCS